MPSHERAIWFMSVKAGVGQRLIPASGGAGTESGFEPVVQPDSLAREFLPSYASRIPIS